MIKRGSSIFISIVRRTCKSSVTLEIKLNEINRTVSPAVVYIAKG